MPMAQSEKRVGAHEAKQDAVRRELRSQGEQGLQGEVGDSEGLGRVSQGDRETWFAGDGQPGHGQPVFKAGGGSIELERLCADRGEENCLQAESRTGSARDRQVAKMGRVETAAEEGDARGVRWG